MSRYQWIIFDADGTLFDFESAQRLALATNGIAEVQRRRFSKSALKNFFKAVVISDEIGVAKPAAAFFEIVFARIGNPPKKSVLMVGDSLSSDIAGGAGFGIDTCWFNPSSCSNESSVKPTYEISDLTELPELIGAS
jgi:2-haloacid dehalogenase